MTFRHFQIQRIPKKIRQKLHKNLKDMPELKATKCDTNVHNKIFEELVKCDETILFFNPCKKSLIPLEIKNDPNKEMRIYELVFNELLMIIPNSIISQAHSIHLIIDEHWKNPIVLKHSTKSDENPYN